MKIVLHAGHGKTPPGVLGYCRWTSSGQKAGSRADWHYQRGWQDLPGGGRWIEDLATAELCSQLIPALVAQGHEVYPMRAMDPVTGELDRRAVCAAQALPGASLFGVEEVDERWRYSGAVEAALRHAHGALADLCPISWWRSRGSFDPVAMIWQERQLEADLYLSIHFNWYADRRMYGFSAHHCPGSRRGSAIALRIYQGVLAAFDDDPWAERAKLPWGPARTADGCRWGVYAPGLWELALTRAPAVVLELGFASNPGDLARIVDPAWQARMTSAVAASAGL
ncbi:MAG: N-acetylmuramoyl-L-alanine amidase [Polyangia bacterium]|jgi:N-acetylmuramoyl-L-alanine amidase|nr:N-acetylmuramoyl-L-alanine amidase [Polyangia bacterium]